MRDLVVGHPRTTIIRAHVGAGRVVRPVKDQLSMVARALENPALSHVYFDISWDEAAKYLVETPETVQGGADLINRFPDPFLFGTDEVGPTDQAKYRRPMICTHPSLPGSPPKRARRSGRETTNASSTRPAVRCRPGKRWI